MWNMTQPDRKTDAERQADGESSEADELEADGRQRSQREREHEPDAERDQRDDDCARRSSDQGTSR